MYLVKEIADLAGVSVRTLHHYDQKDLFKPDFLDVNGYRMYSEESLSILQHIMFLKELDFTLKQISSIIHNPIFNKMEALLKQKIIIKKKRDRLNSIIKNLDKTISSIKDGTKMETKDMFDSFNMDEIRDSEKKYAEETKKKYGNTVAYKESKKRTAKYSEKDWSTIMAESHNIMINLASLMNNKVSDKEVQEIIKLWQSHISKYYYECTLEILESLGESYVDDIRFTKNIDKHGDGLSIFFRDAIRFYCKNPK